MNNRDLISQFKDLLDLKSDADAAAVLGLQKSEISGYINDKRHMPVNLRFRVLDHIQFSPETKKFAAVFLDIKEHEVLMTQDLDRLEEVKRRRAGMPVNFTDQKWIERVIQLQAKHDLSDAQTAKFLDATTEELAQMKAGERELNLGQKMTVLSYATVSSINKVSTKKLKTKLDKRVKQK